jgi:hypothetical protein
MKIMTGIAGVLVAAAMAGSAMADGIVNTDYAGGNLTGFNGGGGFRMTQISGYNGENGGTGGTANSFVTFCLEENEYFSPGSNYFTQIATSTANGGVSGGNPDPIDGITARMYLEFRNGGSFGGVVPGGVWNNSTISSLQLAIWYEEGERPLSDLDANALAMLAWGTANSDGALHGVRVVRQWSSYDPQSGFSGNAQDMLTIVPLPPAATAGLATMAGVLGLGYARRRKLSAL